MKKPDAMPILPTTFSCPVCLLNNGSKGSIGPTFKGSNTHYEPGCRVGKVYRKKYYKCSKCHTIFTLRQNFEDYGIRTDVIYKDAGGEHVHELRTE